MRQQSLNWRPLLLIALVSGLLTWLISSLVIQQGFRGYQDRINSLATRLAEDHRKANILGAITSIAGTDPDIRATVRGELPPDNPQVMAKLRYVFEHLKLDNMILMAADGEVKAYMVHNVKTSITGKNYGWRPYFQGPMQGRDSMYAAFGSNSLERGFYISTPIPASGEAADRSTPAGVIVTKLGFLEIDQQLAKERLPVAVLSPEGVVFATNETPWLYQVMGDEKTLETARNDRRVNNAYKEHPPSLISMKSGTISLLGRQLQVFKTSIGWPDPSGTWQLAGFINEEDIFGWPARVITAGSIFLLLLLIHTWLKARKRAQERTEQVVSLLDNSGEGFLSFGRNFLVDNEYSQACEAMLEVMPAGQDIASLLFAGDADKAQLMREVIGSALLEQDAEVQASMLSLLPREISRGRRLLDVDYRRIGPEKFMVILTDITTQRHTAQLLEQEQCHLKMVVLAISDSRNLFDTLDSFRDFLARLQEPSLMQVSTAELATNFYREIHTFKGLFNQFSFPELPLLLHETEGRISSLLATGQAIEHQALLEALAPETLQSTLELDLKILRSTIGDEFLIQGRTLVLNQQQAHHLNCLAKRLLQGEPINPKHPELLQLFRDISQLCKVRLVDALKGHDRLIQQVATRLEKQVAPLEIKGGEEIYLVADVWKHFLQSLAHIFRNAVIHGLEPADVRWEQDKDDQGRISCDISTQGELLRLDISDDGAGLDLDALRAKASARGLASADQLSDQEAAQLIFQDQISTQTSANDLAGRGVGLAAVLAETQRLGGELKVTTRPGQGTSFHFELPLNPAQEICPP